jgi:hypothetical protein
MPPLPTKDVIPDQGYHTSQGMMIDEYRAMIEKKMQLEEI